jgi:hypothetical protein
MMVAPLFYHSQDEEQSDFQSSSSLNNTTDDDEKTSSNRQKDGTRRHVQIQREKRRKVRMLSPFSPRRLLSRRHYTVQQQQQQENRAKLIEYEQRKAAWAAKYTSVTTLRTTFGTNKNMIWGDFDPFATRRLYHTLLPRALLELRGLRDMMLDNTSKLSYSSSKGKEERSSTTTNNNNNNDDNNNNHNNHNVDLIIKQELKELAPLAYQARVAAKKYARERSRLPGRIGSMLYDGYRQWRRYGKWDNSGMSWDQVWAKYEDQVLGEVMEEMMMSSSSSSSRGVDVDLDDEELPSTTTTTTTAATLFSYGNDLDDEELTARICLRILERSVATNEMVDKLFRRTDEDDENSSSNSSSSSGESISLKRRKRYERQRQRKNRILNDLQAIEKKFDDDIQELLRYSKFTTEEGEERRRKRQKGAFFWKKSMLSSSSHHANDDDEVSRVVDETTSALSRAVGVTASTRGGGVDTTNASVESSESNDVAAALFSVSDANTTPKKSPSRRRTLARHEVVALRILAKTKQRIASLQATKEEDEENQ